MDRQVVLNLRIIAGLAEKLADDVDRGRLWEGEFQERYGEISRHMKDLQSTADKDRRY